MKKEPIPKNTNAKVFPSDLAYIKSQRIGTELQVETLHRLLQKTKNKETNEEEIKQ